MNILFFGSLYPDDRIKDIRANSRYFDIPSNTLQNALVAGFDSFSNQIVVTAPSIKRYSKLFFRSSKFSHNTASTDICLPQIDIPAIKEILLSESFYRAIKHMESIDAIFIYSTSYQALKAASRYKKKHPGVCIVNMIADLPEYMSQSKSLYKFLKEIGVKMYYRIINQVDGFVLLAPKMRERMPIEHKPWIQIEGVYNDSVAIEPQEKSPYKVILYTGALDRRYGIEDLVSAFIGIKNSDYRLWICGGGNSVPMIQEAAIRDSRINYLGVISREEVLALQKRATVLVNPRHSSEEFTKYSFPSKTMEYMASGTPTLMSPLQCLPEEYAQYLYFFDDESIEGIRNKIIEVCETDRSQLQTFGDKASAFILGSKTQIHQCKRIISFIDKLLSRSETN